ncbi:hypothetical protein COO60DRAFT_1508804 [Scenedesmus sp. NREL 46B-D3]|nr:hypothetical protein COO60DRAFT_1508804 [Scenedesmus sp. NREL 46B-D3]
MQLSLVSKLSRWALLPCLPLLAAYLAEHTCGGRYTAGCQCCARCDAGEHVRQSHHETVSDVARTYQAAVACTCGLPSDCMVVQLIYQAK